MAGVIPQPFPIGTDLNIEDKLTLSNSTDDEGELIIFGGEGNAICLDITSVGTNHSIYVNEDKNKASGKFALYIESNVTQSNSSLVKFFQDEASTNKPTLTLEMDGTGDNLFIDTDGNAISIKIDTEATTAEVIDIDNPQQTTGDIIKCSDANALTTGGILNFGSNSSSSSARDLITLINNNTLATGTRCLHIRQDAAKEAVSIDMGTLDAGFFNFLATANADATSAISTLNTSGATTDHIQIELNGVKAWIAVSTNNPT